MALQVCSEAPKCECLIDLSGLTLPSCTEPIRHGTVVAKSYDEAYSETRLHDVYKYDCDSHKKPAMGDAKNYGCGMGYDEGAYRPGTEESL